MSVDSTATLTSFKEANVYFKFTRFLISCTGLHLLPLDRSVSPFFLAFRGTRALLAVLISKHYILALRGHPEMTSSYKHGSTPRQESIKTEGGVA